MNIKKYDQEEPLKFIHIAIAISVLGERIILNFKNLSIREVVKKLDILRSG